MKNPSMMRTQNEQSLVHVASITDSGKLHQLSSHLKVEELLTYTRRKISYNIQFSSMESSLLTFLFLTIGVTARKFLSSLL